MPGTVTFTGMCDASGAVPLTSSTFLVADDEDNVLRAYDAERGGAPLWSADISQAIDIAAPKKPGKPAPEADIEAATRAEGLAFWLTSHGRNSSGKLKRERFRFFATTVPDSAATLKVVGRAYVGLLDDVLHDARFASYGLTEAAARAPKAEGGLNLEGMTARAEGGVWIGFRNPKPGGKALLFALLNPTELVQIEGARARLGDPLLLDLGGLSVRALSRLAGQYLIVAGGHDGAEASQLYRWDGKGAPRRVQRAPLDELNPEGFFSPLSGERFMLLSDDGSRRVGARECKRADPSQKSFRGRWLSLN
jgi:hypothetical protein